MDRDSKENFEVSVRERRERTGRRSRGIAHHRGRARRESQMNLGSASIRAGLGEPAFQPESRRDPVGLVRDLNVLDPRDSEEAYLPVPCRRSHDRPRGVDVRDPEDAELGRHHIRPLLEIGEPDLPALPDGRPDCLVDALPIRRQFDDLRIADDQVADIRDPIAKALG